MKLKERIPKPDYKSVLPGKKKKEKFKKERKKLLKSIKEHGNDPDTKLVGKAFSFIAGIPKIASSRSERKLVERAFSFSEEKHRRQKRLSGDPYFSHAFETALVLSGHGLDSETIAAALLHDVLEDTEVSEKEIRAAFGKEVLSLVKGVTKLAHYEEEELEAEERAYLKNLLCASSKDVRVLLIKLADKIHNLRTIGFLPPERRKQICENALEVYAPLAERFGLRKMREEIEDICFRELYPKKYRALKKEVARRGKKQLSEVKKAVKALSEVKLGRRKKFFGKYSWKILRRHPYYYYERTKRKLKTLDEFYDYSILIILGEEIDDCYEALRIVHEKFYPIPGKLRDYIAAPASLTYRSIHTSVIGPSGKPLKIFIRTKEMDELSEKGIAVLLAEKGESREIEREADYFRKISSISNSQEEFLTALKSDFLEDRINVFTSGGKKISLPSGSTAVDFAFKQSPSKAGKAAQAEINGRLKPVWTRLRRGDRVKLVYSGEKTIEREWLDFAKTFYARETIKDELGIEREKSEKRAILRYDFRAAEKKGIIIKILSSLQKAHARIEEFSVRKTPKGFEGKLVVFAGKRGSEKEIAEALASIKGIEETGRG